MDEEGAEEVRALVAKGYGIEATLRAFTANTPWISGYVGCPGS
jgi:hypothetical protein